MYIWKKNMFQTTNQGKDGNILETLGCRDVMELM